MRKILLAAALLLMLIPNAGLCAAPAQDTVSGSFPTAAVFFAPDAARLIEGAYGASARPELSVDPRTPFGAALGDALRKSGFPVSADGLPVGYIFALTDNDKALTVDILLPNDRTLSKRYTTAFVGDTPPPAARTAPRSPSSDAQATESTSTRFPVLEPIPASAPEPAAHAEQPQAPPAYAPPLQTHTSASATPPAPAVTPPQASAAPVAPAAPVSALPPASTPQLVPIPLAPVPPAAAASPEIPALPAAPAPQPQGARAAVPLPATVIPAADVPASAGAAAPVPVPHAGVPKVTPATALPTYSLEALSAPPNVTILVRKGGLPVGEGVVVRFEADSAYPNLRPIERKTDGDGRIVLRNLMVTRDAESLRASVQGQSGILCPLPGSRVPGAKAAAVPAGGVSASRSGAASAHVPASVPTSASGASAHAERPVLEKAPAVVAPLSPSLPASGYAGAEKGVWSLGPGLLRNNVQNWASRAGYQLVWHSSTDFELSARSEFSGDFIEVVTKAFHALHDQGTPLRVSIHKANNVLVVSDD